VQAVTGGVGTIDTLVTAQKVRLFLE